MFENIMKFFKKLTKKEEAASNSKDTAKERLHLVLVQDRAHVSADFLDLMKQEIIEVIKKYIEVDESLIDVHLTNHGNEDGTNGAPALYANIPIKNIKEAARKADKVVNEKNNNNEINEDKKENTKKETNKESIEKPKNIKEEKDAKTEDTKDSSGKEENIKNNEDEIKENIGKEEKIESKKEVKEIIEENNDNNTKEKEKVKSED